MVEAIVTRSGVFEYMKLDGIQRQLRHPDDVFSSESLNSLKMIPVTLDHPAGLVTTEDAKKLSVGFTGESVRVDGENLIVTLKITDEEAIKAIESGKNELSLGYTLDLLDETGMYKGEKYDKRQTNISYNHLAIVDRARAGANAKIHLDNADAVDAVQLDEMVLNIDNQDFNNSKGVKPMYKINIDGVEHEIDNLEIVKYVKKLEKDNSDLNAKMETVSGDLDKKSAELDTANEKIENLTNVDNAEAIAKGVSARLDLERTATTVLGDSVGEGDKAKKVSELDEADIKKAVIKKVFPKRELDGKSDTYIESAFEIAVDTFKETKGDNDLDQNNDLDNQLEEINSDAVDYGQKNSDSARAAMIANRGKKAK